MSSAAKEANDWKINQAAEDAIIAERQKEAPVLYPYSRAPIVESAEGGLREVAYQMWTEWDKPIIQNTVTVFRFSLMLARDVEIKAGLIHESWAATFTNMQEEIATIKFWKQMFWLMRVEYKL